MSVVDASVALKWVIPEALSDKADQLRAQAGPLLAPDLLLVEAANALWKKHARREISAREADRALQLLMESGVDLRPTPSLLPRALELGRLLGHPVCDCTYLALAEQEKSPLVTADTLLLERAARHRLVVRIIDLRRS